MPIYKSIDQAVAVMDSLDGVTLEASDRQESLSNRDVGGYRDCPRTRCAYADGIVHRDIKPANVFVTTAQILDFGLAKQSTAKGVGSFGDGQS